MAVDRLRIEPVLSEAGAQRLPHHLLHIRVGHEPFDFGFRPFVVRDGAHLDEVQALPGIADIVCQPAQEIESTGNVTGLVMRPARLDPVRLQEFLDALAKNEIVQPVGIQVGQSVMVVAGPFASFPATVEAVLPGDRLRVAVSIFGRPSPVELGITDVQAV